MADDTLTVEQALANYRKARTEWYELSGNADSADVLLFHAEMELALDALIAAVRAEIAERVRLKARLFEPNEGAYNALVQLHNEIDPE